MLDDAVGVNSSLAPVFQWTPLASSLWRSGQVHPYPSWSSANPGRGAKNLLVWGSPPGTPADAGVAAAVPRTIPPLGRRPPLMDDAHWPWASPHTARDATGDLRGGAGRRRLEDPASDAEESHGLVRREGEHPRPPEQKSINNLVPAVNSAFSLTSTLPDLAAPFRRTLLRTARIKRRRSRRCADATGE